MSSVIGSGSSSEPALVQEKILPGVHMSLFPHDGHNHFALVAITSLGVALFLLAAGMEVDLKLVKKEGKIAWLISLAGIAVPFLLAFVPAFLFPNLLGSNRDTSPIIFALFVGAAISLTALATSAKMLADLNLLKTPFGALIISSAVLDDFLGWILVGIVFAFDNLHDNGVFTAGRIVFMTIATIAFALLMLTVGRWLCDRFIAAAYRHCAKPGGVIGFIMGLGLLGAGVTQALGIHGLFGAFLVGVVVGSSNVRQETREAIEEFIANFLAPLYFASIGLSVDFIANFSWPCVTIVLLVACVGKILGCYLIARYERLSHITSLAVGVAMNSRGGIEIILATMALEEQIIDERMFVALAIMAVVTSSLAGRMLESMASHLQTVDPAALQPSEASDITIESATT